MSNEKPIYVFLDTEFTELHCVDRELISIGVCANTTNGIVTYYAELDDSYTLSDCSDFVKKNVLPYLEKKHVVIYHKMLLELCSFIENLEGDVFLVSDAPAWDFSLLHPLLHDLSIRPPNLKGLAKIKVGPVLPIEAEYLRDHHALDDALLNLYYARQNLEAIGTDGIEILHSFAG